jgi:hypothetical protein
MLIKITNKQLIKFSWRRNGSNVSDWRVFHSDQVLKQAKEQAASTGMVSVAFVKGFCLVKVDAKINEHSEQARAPHTNGPRDVPRCGALSSSSKAAKRLDLI